MAPTQTSSRVFEARARLGRATRYKGDTAPETVDARRDLAAAVIEKRVSDIVATAPPLRDDQIERILRALRGAR